MYNKVILIGNTGKDPEVRTVGDKKVCSFSLATSKSYKDKNGERKNVSQWHNIQLWSPLAEIAEKYVKKGMKIQIEGEIEYREYEKDGVKKFITEIRGTTMNMLESIKGEAKAEVPAPAAEITTTLPPAPAMPDMPVDDLPF